MGDRLKKLREALGLKQGVFARRISTTQGHISDIENGRKILGDKSIKLIVHEFNVNEEWLRYGTGEMLLKDLQEDQYTYYAMRIATEYGRHGFVKNAIIKYGELDSSSQDIINNYMESLINAKKE